MLLSIATPVFAELAPVYDADQMPQQFDNNSSDQGSYQGSYQDQDLPPAPAEEGTFVPMQAQTHDNFPPSANNQPTPSMSMEQRMKRVEQQINNIQNNNDASARLDSLQNQVQTLQGQVEQLTHQLQQLQSQPPSSSIPVITKSTRKPAAAKKPANEAATDITTTKSSPDQPNVAEEQQIYQTAYNLIKAKKYNDAVNALQAMLKKYPSGQFASNAHYWLGELYGLMGKNDQALTEFEIVVNSYPDSPRVSDAQLKIGLIYASQSKWSNAKIAFKKVINHYPGSAPSRLAQEQLKQIKQAGH